MSDVKNRYDFDGFTFGSNGLFQLTVKTLTKSGYGHTVEFGIELTPEERQALITVLIAFGKPKETD
jgi:hypothetical protein